MHNNTSVLPQHFEREGLIWKSTRLNPTQKFILLAINSFVGADGKCFPSQARLAKMTGYTRRTVNSALKSLETENFIRIQHQYRQNRSQTSSLYFVNWNDLIEKHPCENISYPLGNDFIPPEKEDHTSNYPKELSNLTTHSDIDKQSSDVLDTHEESPSGLEQSNEIEMPILCQDVFTGAHIPIGNDGWINLKGFRAKRGQKELGSWIRTYAIRETHKALLRLPIEGIEFFEDEGYVDCNGYAYSLESVLKSDSPLPLRKLRNWAFSQGLIDQDSFNDYMLSKLNYAADHYWKQRRTA